MVGRYGQDACNSSLGQINITAESFKLADDATGNARRPTKGDDRRINRDWTPQGRG